MPVSVTRSDWGRRRQSSGAEWIGTARSQSPQMTRLGVVGRRRSERRSSDISLCQVCQEAQEVEDGAGGAKVVAVGLEALGGIPALWAGHAAEADHLEPLGQPGHAVGEELAGAGEVETDERVGFAEVGMRRRDQDQRANRIRVVGGGGHGDRSAVGVTEEDRLVQVELGEDAANELCGGREAGVNVVTALRLTGAGKVERDDVLVRVQCLHKGHEGVGATHQPVGEGRVRADPSPCDLVRGRTGEGHRAECVGASSCAEKWVG